MNLNTHLKINAALCGDVIELKKGYAKVMLITTADMAADAKGLIHGGFIFGAADFSAMAAVNEPNVVLAGSSCKFLAPSKIGESIEFEAIIVESTGIKHRVEVTGTSNEKTVFLGEFKTAVTKTHVLG